MTIIGKVASSAVNFIAGNRPQTRRQKKGCLTEEQAKIVTEALKNPSEENGAKYAELSSGEYGVLARNHMDKEATEQAERNGKNASDAMLVGMAAFAIFLAKRSQ